MSEYEWQWSREVCTWWTLHKGKRVIGSLINDRGWAWNRRCESPLTPADKAEVAQKLDELNGKD